MDNKGKLIIKNEKGEEKEFSILVTFDIEQRNKSYVLYTDYSHTEDGNLKVYASTYDKYDENDILGKVTEKDEIELIDNYLKELEEDLKSGIKLV